MKFTPRFLKSWVPLAALATLLVGLTYVAVQQSYRSSANDPQIQMAEDAVALLDGGALPKSVLPQNSVELTTSLSPFLIIYDSSGDPKLSNATLQDIVPVIPLGSLVYAKANGENRITWQPAPDVRIASVIVPFSGGDGGYVLAGRSLREVENRVSQLTTMLGLGWAVTLAITLFLVLVLETFLRHEV
jgi:hypothetical protein